MKLNRYLSLSTSCFLFGFISIGLASTAFAEISVQHYGFIKPTLTLSGNAASSFGNKNMNAATAAFPITNRLDERGRTNFNIGQSRYGMDIKANEQLTGRIELDFVNFDKASPSTAALPRVRIAKIEYSMSEGLTIMAGQDWDLFSPVNPHTFNFVGNYFQGGNSGFMRQQLNLKCRSESTEVAVGLGSPGNNNDRGDASVELTELPVLQARLTYLIDPKNKLGTGALYNRRGYILGNDVIRRSVLGYTLFADLEFSPMIQFRTEGYYGRNLNDSGALTLSNGTANQTQNEIGGYATTKINLDAKLSVFGGVGIAKVLNDEDVAISVVSSSAGITQSVNNSITENKQIKAGIAYKPQPELTTYIELARFITNYRAVGSDLAANNTAAELGMLLNF